MTFTKEKLQQLENAIYDTIHGLRIGDPNPRDVDLVVQAAIALPHYITALAEAERALTESTELVNLMHTQLAKVTGGDTIYLPMLNRSNAALTTIRQLASGES